MFQKKSMKPSDELFQLVKSMTKSEKIFFKKYSKKNAGPVNNNYIRLFNEMDRQESYDENKIKDVFRNDVFSKQLHVSKNYLFDHILKSLKEFYLDKNDEISVYYNLMKIRILLDRNMNKSALKIVKKFKETAAGHQDYHQLYLLLNHEAQLTAKNYTAKAEAGLDRLTREKSDCIVKLKEFDIYNSLLMKLNVISARWTYSNDKKDIEAMRKILGDPLLVNEDNAAGFRAKYILYVIKAKIFRYLMDDKKSIEYRKKSIDLMQQYPETIERNPSVYAGRLYDFINYCIAEGNFSLGAEYLTQLKKYTDLAISRSNNPAEISLAWYEYSNMMLRNLEDNNEAALFMKKIEGEYELYCKNLSKRYLFDFILSCARVYFAIEDYERSLAWIKKYTGHKDAPVFEEIYHTIVLFTIVLHIELENYELVESLIRKTRRFYDKQNKLYISEKTLLNYLNKIFNAKDNDELMMLFTRLKKDIRELKKNPAENRVLIAFDFEGWTDKNIDKLKK